MKLTIICVPFTESEASPSVPNPHIYPPFSYTNFCCFPLSIIQSNIFKYWINNMVSANSFLWSKYHLLAIILLHRLIISTIWTSCCIMQNVLILFIKNVLESTRKNIVWSLLMIILHQCAYHVIFYNVKI